MSTSTEVSARSQIALDQIRSDFQVARGKHPEVSACMVHLPGGVELPQEEWPEGFRSAVGYQWCPFGRHPESGVPIATRHVRFQGPPEAVSAVLAAAEAARASLLAFQPKDLPGRLPEGVLECKGAIGWFALLFDMALLPEGQSLLHVWRSDEGGRFDWKAGPPCEYRFLPEVGNGERWAAVLPDVARASEIGARELRHLPVKSTKARLEQGVLGAAISAAALLSQNPGLSDRAIAKEVGCSPSTLSRSPVYKGAREAFRGGRELKRGYRTRGRHGGPGDIEAIDLCNPCRSSAGPTPSHPEHGTHARDNDGPVLVPIHGSKLYREHCAECGEAIRVPKDQVGTNPVCEACLQF
jgi:hypothetical protein